MPSTPVLERLKAALQQSREKPINDLDRAYKALAEKLPIYNDLWDYYDGDHPLMYAARRMRELFADLDMSTFVENWCAVVIDSANDRIVLEGLNCKDATADKQLAENWETYNLAIESNDTHESALVTGEAFILVWAETIEEETANRDELQIFYNDPRLCHLFYEPGNPRKKRFGAKWWVDFDGFTRMTLYYPSHLEYYRSKKANEPLKDSKGFEKLKDDVENPYKEVPFFHYRPERRVIKSDLTNAIPLQNGINKLLTDMMVAAEYGAFRQRWIISNADTTNLKNAPNEIWEIPAGDGQGQQAQVGEFDPTDLSNYIQAIDSMAAAIASITRTPKHYLFGQSGDPSGEALIAMEAPLNKRCKDHIARFTPTWKDVARFMLKVQGIDVEAKDITATFADPETVPPKTEAEIRNFGKSAGIPLITLLRDEGKDEAWIDQMLKDKKKEQEASPMAGMLADIRAGRDIQNRDEGDEQE